MGRAIRRRKSNKDKQCNCQLIGGSLKIPNGQAEVVNRRWTGNKHNGQMKMEKKTNNDL